MKKILLNCILVFSISSLFCTSKVKMEPIKISQNYYYDMQDIEHKHIDLKKALWFMKDRLLSIRSWISMVTKLFYHSDTKVDAVALLSPEQSVPVERSQKLKITWIGQASLLIQVDGFNIITDPIFGDVKAGPITVTKRAMPPGIKLEDLPPIDAVLISHNHSDHTDTKSLMAIAQMFDPTIFVPVGNKAMAQSMGFSKVVERSWWQQEILELAGKQLKITCVPAKHWSIRFSLGSYRKSLWAGWMISAGNKNIYFAGDTAMGSHFAQIAEQFKKIDVALMPIGPTTEGENRHKYNHVDAPEAIDAFIELKAQLFLPIHYGTFFAGPDTIIHPIAKLKSGWQERAEKLKDKKLLVAICGKEYLLSI